jgi:nucleotide-binding universal stress UspA family protein
VWIEVAIVSICFLALGTNEETYLAIYAAGVFILLSLTGWAATNRLIRQVKTSSSAKNIFSLSGTILAATFSSLATAIIFAERFKEGAWTYFILLPFLYLLFTYFRNRLGEPTPVEERRGRLFAERRYLPVDDHDVGANVTAIQRILVPLDGSPFAEEALRLAQAFSGTHNSRLVLVSVQQTTGVPRSIPFLQSGPGQDGNLSEYEKYLHQVAGKLGQTGDHIEVFVETGDIVEQITKTAQQQAVDLLIMSTHGRSGFGRALIGSVADKVINQINIPTLLIRPVSDEPLQPPTFAKILVTLDGSTEAEQVLPFASVVAGRNKSEILLLSVPDELQTEAQQDKLRQYLEAMALSFRATGVPTKTLVAGSSPGYTIVEVANGEAVDLIMLASHGRGGFARLMMGSVADTVVHHTRQPVFLVPVR